MAAEIDAGVAGAMPTDLGALAGGFAWAAVAAGVAALAWTAAPRLLPGGDGGAAERLLRAALLTTLAMVWTVAALGFAGWLTGPAVALVTLLALGAAAAFAVVAGPRSAPANLPSPAPPVASPLAGLGWPAAFTGVLVGVDLLVWLPAPPVGWDAMTYHLYLPARWLQEGRLFHVPTVFSDDAAAFAPQNGALFFAWQMALSGRDALTNVVQVAGLGVLMLALYRLARRLGVAAEPAALAALTLPWLPPVREWTWSANVDVFMLAFWLAALAWQLGYGERPARGTVAAAGLAGGLAAGTKAIALPLAGLPALVFTGYLLARRRFAEPALLLACAIAGGGWWYLRNAALYGNPLFPVSFSFAGVELPGAYDTAAIRAGEFHVDGPLAVARSVVAQFGLGTWLLTVAGLLALAVRAVRRRSLVAGALLALGLGWALYFALVVPHNNQARFALPVVLLGLVGWGVILAAAASGLPQPRGRWPVRALWLAGVAGAAFAAPPWPLWQSWREQLATLVRGGGDALRWLVFGAFCLASLALLARFARRAAGRTLVLTALVGWLLAGSLAGLAAVAADTARTAFLARADFRGWAAGYLPFNDPGSAPLRLAYTGANVPYALMGSGWRHRVVYLDTQGEQGDSFYDHWRRDPQQHPYHKPGLYRGRDEEARWLAHLDAERIQLLVVFRLHRAEARYLRATPGGFPVEQAWARGRPDRFTPIAAGPAAEIFMVRLLAP